VITLGSTRLTLADVVAVARANGGAARPVALGADARAHEGES